MGWGGVREEGKGKGGGGGEGFHGAPAPDPPLTNCLCRWSLAGAPRRGSLGSALTAPLKTFRFQRWA